MNNNFYPQQQFGIGSYYILVMQERLTHSMIRKQMSHTAAAYKVRYAREKKLREQAK